METSSYDYTLPVMAIASKVHLAWQANCKVRTIITICFVISYKIMSVCVKIEKGQKLTDGNHVGDIS